METLYNKVFKHPKFIEYYKKIEDLEEDRIFCRHNMTHFLDVARIGYIMILEQKLNISKEDMYLVALLHDIGRFEEYLYGTPHEIASARLALPILKDIGLSTQSIERLQHAIINHRNIDMMSNNDLAGVLYRADKASRPCHTCKAADKCNWSPDKMNLQLNI